MRFHKLPDQLRNAIIAQGFDGYHKNVRKFLIMIGDAIDHIKPAKDRLVTEFVHIRFRDLFKNGALSRQIKMLNGHFAHRTGRAVDGCFHAWKIIQLGPDILARPLSDQHMLLRLEYQEMQVPFHLDRSFLSGREIIHLINPVSRAPVVENTARAIGSGRCALKGSEFHDGLVVEARVIRGEDLPCLFQDVLFKAGIV